MGRKSDQAEREGFIMAAGCAPELDWHRGFGRLIYGLLRRYGTEDQNRQKDGPVAWWNRPWNDADREVADRIRFDRI